MLAQIDKQLAALRTQAQQAEEEAAKIRPRFQYLQEMLLRLEGAMVALTQLKESLPQEVSVPSVLNFDSLHQPVAP